MAGAMTAKRGAKDSGIARSASRSAAREGPGPHPARELVIDCLYFSTITIATVGYGDIRPVYPVAKAAVMLEVVAGFLWIVVCIGAVIGPKKE